MINVTGIFDSHAHYNDKQFNGDRDSLLESLKYKGVDYVINVGDDLRGSRESVSLSERYSFIYATVGIHPHNCLKTPSNYPKQLEELSRNKKVVAIGEIGLDYYYDFCPRDLQLKFLETQMELAIKLDLPVVVHSRDAASDTLALLKNFPKSRGVVHCFSYGSKTAETLVDIGYHIGFTGVITFANARKSVEAAEIIPAERILVETDCPYLAPVPYRGQRCDSTMLPYVVEKLAVTKGIPYQEMADITRENVFKLMSITPD